MTDSSLTIWCGTYFTEATRNAEDALREGVGHHRLVFDGSASANAQNGEAAAAKTPLAEADIAFGQPDAGEVMNSARLRWVHLDSAGYTAYDRDDFRAALQRRNGILTNSSSVYDEPCAQHLLAMITGLARGLPASLKAQLDSRSWQMAEIREHSQLLNNQTVLILGFGAIARRLTELLQPLHMNLIGVRRHVRGDEGIMVINEDEVNSYLPMADHVVNILPANDSTKKFMGDERLKATKPGAILYNIGRGTTLDQNALLSLLQSGRLRAAYLDVTDPEPLPPEHPLWTAPNCYITPHTAGGHANEKMRQVEHFLQNLRRFTHGENMLDHIL